MALFLFLLSLAVVCEARVPVQEISLGLLLENPDGNETTVLKHTMDYLRTFENSFRDVHISLVTRIVQSGNNSTAVTKVCELFEKGVSGLLSWSTCSTLKALRAQQVLFQIPHMAVYPGHCSDFRLSNHQYTLSLRAQGSVIIAALIDVVTHLSWTEVVIFYDDTYASVQLTTLIFSLSTHFVKSSLVSVIRPDRTLQNHSRATLESFLSKPTPPTNFLLLLSERNAFVVLTMALELGLLSETKFWLVVNNDVSSVPSSRLRVFGGNIALLEKSWRNPSCFLPISAYINTKMPYLTPKDAYLVDGFVTLAQVVYRNVSETDRENGSASINCGVLPIMPSAQGDLMMTELRKVNYSGISGALYFDEDGYNGNTKHDVLSLVEEGLSRKFVHVGLWNKASGLDITKQIFTQKNRGFNNYKFKVGAKEAIPFLIKNQTENGTDFTGLCVDILRELAMQLNFRYELIEPSDDQWGSEETNGSFNGIVGMVMSGDLDFGIGPFGINAEREKGIDFTTPYMEDGIGIVMKRPVAEANKIFRMFRPFSGMVWLAIAGSVVFIGVGLFVLTKLSPVRRPGDTLKDENVTSLRQDSLKESMWIIFASLMEQGSDNYPVALSGRLILGFWWLFTILIVSSYTANLAAFLTVTILDKPVQTLEDLATSEDIMPLVKTGTNIYSSFKNGKSDVYRKIWGKLQLGPQLTENDAAYDYVRTGKYAFMVDYTQLEYLVKRECETFILADQSFNNAGLGFVFPENSPMLETVSYSLIRMQEAGLIERWRQLWWRSSDTCLHSGPTSQAKHLKLDSTGGPFIIFAVAAGVAFVCLIFELTWSYYKQGKIDVNDVAKI